MSAVPGLAGRPGGPQPPGPGRPLYAHQVVVRRRLPVPVVLNGERGRLPTLEGRGMTLAVQRQVLATAPPDLSRPARRVLEVLGFLCGPKNGIRWPVGDSRLVRETGYSLSSVRRGRRELVSRGLLEVEAVGLGRDRSRYRLLQLEAVQAPLAVAVGAENEHSGWSGRPHGVVRVTTPNARAPQLFQISPALTQEGKGPERDEEDALRATEPHIGPADAGTQPRCPRAAARGMPCASCRACQTNPRSLRAARRRPVASEVVLRNRALNPATNIEQRARNAEGAESARAALRSRLAGGRP